MEYVLDERSKNEILYNLRQLSLYGTLLVDSRKPSSVDLGEAVLELTDRIREELGACPAATKDEK